MLMRSRRLWRIHLATRYLSILRVPHPQFQVVLALLPRHQRFTCISLGRIVHGVDPNEHARMIADAGNVISSMRHEAQDLLNRAEQQIARSQHEAQTVSVQAQYQVSIAKQQAQSAVQQVHQQAQAEVAIAKQQVLLSESLVIELRQRNSQLEQQQSEMIQQMAQLQSMVHQIMRSRQTSQEHAHQIESPAAPSYVPAKASSAKAAMAKLK